LKILETVLRDKPQASAISCIVTRLTAILFTPKYISSKLTIPRRFAKNKMCKM